MKKINLLVTILLTTLTHDSFSQAGTLDSSFGTGGIVITAIDSFQDGARSVAIQPDGKIVQGGFSSGGFTVVRYNADGTLDNSFNGIGIVTTALGPNYGQAFSVGIQSDGKIVEAGSYYTGPNNDFALVRYNAAGTLDSSFGTEGKAITDIDSQDNRALSVAIQPDGKIVAAGQSFNGSNYDFALVRYNSDGTLDNSFNTTGKVTTDFGVNDDAVSSVIVQPDGKIVAAGYASNGPSQVFAVVRYKTDGTLDSLFGVDGKVISPVGIRYNRANSVAIQPDGKIIAAGYSINDDFTFSYFALVRYNSNGTLDNSFGTNGQLTTVIDSGDNAAFSVAVQPDGKIVAAGHSNYDFALVRYNSDGTLDSIFGTDGKLTTDIDSIDDEAFSMAIQPDGKIVVGGSTYIDGKVEFALARYLSGLILGILDFSSSSTSLFIYPNPIQQTEQLEYTLSNDEVLTLSLNDVNGRVINNFFTQQKRTAGSHKEQLNMGALAAGNYFLTLSNGTQKMTVKMVKQ